MTALVSRKKWGGQTRRLLALTIADKANEDGSGVYASVRTLARDAEISEATARRALREFEEQGVLRKVGERPCANGATNIYDLQIDAIEAMGDLKPDRAHREPPRTMRPVSPRSPKRLRPKPKPTAIRTPITVTPLSQRAPTGLTVIAYPILEPISCSNEQESPPKPEAPKPPTGEDLFGAPASPKPKAKPKAKAKPSYTPEFHAFWAAWPKHRRELSDKQTAFRRWSDAIRGGLSAETITGAAGHYLGKREVAKEDFRYCVLAEVFLNGKLDAAVEAFQARTTDAGALARARADLYRKLGKWHPEWGLKPDDPNYSGP